MPPFPFRKPEESGGFTIVTIIFQREDAILSAKGPKIVHALAAASAMSAFLLSPVAHANGKRPHETPREAQTASTPDRKSADAAEIRRLLRAHAAAIARMDIAAIEDMTIASDEYSTVEGGHANWGWADYRDRHLKPEFSSPDFRITGYDILRIHRVRVDRDLAFAVFRYEIRAEVKGRKVARKKFATVVLSRTPQGWKILHEHS